MDNFIKGLLRLPTRNPRYERMVDGISEVMGISTGVSDIRNEFLEFLFVLAGLIGIFLDKGMHHLNVSLLIVASDTYEGNDTENLNPFVKYGVKALFRSGFAQSGTERKRFAGLALYLRKARTDPPDFHPGP